MEFKEVFDLIVSSWPFDESEYPGINDLSEEDKLVFAAEHCLLHVAKSTGAISAVLEEYDHGKKLDYDQRHKIEDSIRKQIVNHLRLAALFGISPEGIEEKIKYFVSHKADGIRTPIS